MPPPPTLPSLLALARACLGFRETALSALGAYCYLDDHASGACRACNARRRWCRRRRRCHRASPAARCSTASPSASRAELELELELSLRTRAAAYYYSLITPSGRQPTTTAAHVHTWRNVGRTLRDGRHVRRLLPSEV